MTKIDSTHIIRISGDKTRDLYKKLSPGTEVKARIIRAYSKNGAVIDIAGKRFRAEFTQGLPEKNLIILTLLERKNGALVFRLKRDDKAENIYNELMKHSLAGSTPRPSLMYNLKRFFSSSSRNLFELSLFLFELDKEKNRKNAVTELSNRLLDSGFPADLIETLNLLLAGGRKTSFNLLLILFLLNKGKTLSDKNEFLSDKNIKKLFHQIDNLIDTEKGNDIIWHLKTLLLNSNHTNYPYLFDFACLDDDKFKPVRCIIDKKTLLFSLDLSELGHIDILSRKIEEIISINVYTEDISTSETLRAGVSIVTEELIHMGIQTQLTIHRTSYVIRQIFELYNKNGSGQFDMKV